MYNYKAGCYKHYIICMIIGRENHEHHYNTELHNYKAGFSGATLVGNHRSDKPSAGALSLEITFQTSSYRVRPSFGFPQCGLPLQMNPNQSGAPHPRGSPGTGLRNISCIDIGEIKTVYLKPVQFTI